MACNCNSINCKSTSCGCKDGALTTPCAYSVCTGTDIELCAECLCAECVTWCSNSFQIEDSAGNIFAIAKGERLSAIIQRVALFLTNPGCANNAVQYLFEVSKTGTTATLGWAGVPTTTTTINVQMKPIGGSWTTVINGGSLAPSIATFQVTGLTPSTEYWFRINAVGPTTCNSVEILVKTPIS